MPPKKKNTRKNKTTLLEFRAWLQGVEEMQPPEWTPTKEQWALIRDKIDVIVDVPAVTTPSRKQTHEPAPTTQAPRAMPLRQPTSTLAPVASQPPTLNAPSATPDAQHDGAPGPYVSPFSA